MLEEGFKEKAAMMQETLDGTIKEMQERAKQAEAEQKEMRKNYERQVACMAEQQEKTQREMTEMVKKAQDAKDDGLFELVGKALDSVLPFKVGNLVSSLGRR